VSRATEFFDAIAGRYERSYALPAELSRTRMKRVLAELPPAPASILDLGVGTGRELAALQDAGYEPTGLDGSRAMLDRCARRSRPVPLLEADFWQPLPLKDASFDAAIALHGTLAHPPGDAALPELARELARVIKQGGVWVIEVPSPAWLDVAEKTRAPQGQRIVRTGAHTCVIEDEVASASIEARVYSETEWRAALAPSWSASVETEGAVEWFIVARRAR
jgi:ubiquinone/menaquinone biosynthesis C-methylase UbiE